MCSEDVSLHVFPRSETLRKKWTNVLRIGKAIMPYSAVCSAHFKTEDFHIPIKDLFVCMSVCKRWRELINYNYCWGHWYSLLDIEELGVDDDTELEDCPLPLLCSRARELKKYVCSPAFNWRTEKCNHLFLYFKYREWKVRFHYPFLAVYYMRKSEMNIYRVTCNSLRFESVFHLYFPAENMDVSFLMNSKYIIVGSYSLTEVYKFIEGRFVIYRSFYINENSFLCELPFDSVEKFKQSSPLFETNICNRFLIDDSLWIEDLMGFKHLICLDSEENQKFANFGRTLFKPAPSSKIIIHCGNMVQITDNKGVFISSFINPCNFDSYRKIKNICYNDNILLIWYSRSGTSFIECRSVLNGSLIRKISVPERTKIAIHPKKDVVYCFTTHFNRYKLSSVSIKTGSKLWTYQVNDLGPYTFLGSFLRIIDERYIMAYPAPFPFHEERFALFTLQGKLLYESCYTSGPLLHISDEALIGDEGGDLHLYSYL